jgi:hypothetical protein
VGDFQGVDAFDRVRRGFVRSSSSSSSSFTRHALVHSDPDPLTQSIPALQFKVLPDPAGPDSVYILGVKGDFERPALEAAGAEEEVQICQAVCQTQAWARDASASN